MTTMMPEMPAAPETSSGNRRNLVLAGGLAAVLVLGGGGYVLLSGGSSDVASGPVPTHHVLPVHKAVTKKAAPKTKVAVVPAVSTVPIGRDPFHALYIAPIENATGSTGTTATGTSTSTGTAAGSTTDVPTMTASYSLKLVKVTGGTNGTAPIFYWSVGGTTKTVLAAQKFGRYGELVTLTYVKSKTNKVLGAVVQVGDDEPLAVKVGETITVK